MRFDVRQTIASNWGQLRMVFLLALCLNHLSFLIYCIDCSFVTVKCSSISYFVASQEWFSFSWLRLGFYDPWHPISQGKLCCLILIALNCPLALLSSAQHPMLGSGNEPFYSVRTQADIVLAACTTFVSCRSDSQLSLGLWWPFWFVVYVYI